MSADDLREWEEDEKTEKWDRVVELVQHAFETGEMPTAFQAGTLVLMPKSDVGKYQSIICLNHMTGLNHRLRFFKSFFPRNPQNSLVSSTIL